MNRAGYLTDSEIERYCTLYNLQPIDGFVTLPGRYAYSGTWYRNNFCGGWFRFYRE